MFKRKSNAAEAASAAPATYGIMAEFSDSDSIIAAAYKIALSLLLTRYETPGTPSSKPTRTSPYMGSQRRSDIVQRACPGACSCLGCWAQVDCLGL